MSNRSTGRCSYEAAKFIKTGLTVITGDTGVSPGTIITGFPPEIITGSAISANAVSAAGL